jgi:hypothetical protein
MISADCELTWASRIQAGDCNEHPTCKECRSSTENSDSKLAREITELVWDTESPLLFHHSNRVYYWGALAGKHRGIRSDPELLYAGAMFHGLDPSAQQRG